MTSAPTAHSELNSNLRACVILAIGGSRLEKDVKDAMDMGDSRVSLLFGLPKGLFPLGVKPCLTWWWEELKRQGLEKKTYLVADARNIKYYERWAMQSGFPPENLLNAGTVNPIQQGLGFIEALDLVFRIKLWPDNTPLPGPVLITTSAFLFDYGSWQSVRFPARIHAEQPEKSVVFIDQNQATLDINLDPVTSCLTTLGSGVQEHYFPVVLRLGTPGLVAARNYLNERLGFSESSHPKMIKGGMNEYIALLQHLATSIDIYAFDPPRHTEYFHRWQRFVPSVAPAAYNDAASPVPLQFHQFPIVQRTHARVGLMGNPSDGFHGRTLSLLINNFWAEVKLIPNSNPTDETVRIQPNPLLDPLNFASLSMAGSIAKRDGYYGASRLFLATFRVFVKYCRANSIKLGAQGFELFYETNIPRQVGLAGSSALITSLFKCLMRFHSLGDTDIAPAIQANLILSAEKDELGIAAGYQDRVVQVYGGLVFMDFSEDLMKSRQYGEYEKLEVSVPEGLWMGKMHSSVKERWEAGDKEVIAAMKTFAELATQGKDALLARDHAKFASLMDQNFELRRKIYGDERLGKESLRMVEIARQHGHVAKFCGSGGAVVGMWKGGSVSGKPEQAKMRALRHALQKEGNGIIFETSMFFDFFVAMQGFVFCSIQPTLE
ncbi:hypothetical protein HK102_001762 [Quaeritorhiza haematococci]|nr:hypothetical protein HK102_001762 [Quaeritorhiza haematococci]